MKKIVVFTGAGVSADSGLATFRDSDGLWANYRIEDVCTPEALRDNRAQVVDFYNMRRREMLGKEPNAGHRAIAGLEKCFDVEVITQNVDNLHERAGSSRVTHLHGELTKLRSSRDPELIVPIDGWEQRLDRLGAFTEVGDVKLERAQARGQAPLEFTFNFKWTDASTP